MLFTTQSGRLFDPLEITPDIIDIQDIAHSLSNLCRFGGHCHQFYSVAQHSLRVASHLPEEFKLQGLLHDATEAYIVDLPRPIKKHLPEYVRMETRVWSAISQKFGLPLKLAPEVEEADDFLLAAELDEIMGDGLAYPHDPIRPVELMYPTDACCYFLREFHRLTRTPI